MQFSTHDPAIINQYAVNTILSHLGIEITEIGDNYICGKMPVDNRTTRPHQVLHGGASCVLAESLGSIASNLLLDKTKEAVGLEINANHVGSAHKGYVFGKAIAAHIGKSTHVWEINITDENGKKICIARLTMLVKRV